MSIFYSKSERGFFHPELHGDNIPTDAVEISESDHQLLLKGSSEGKKIVADESGFPVLKNPPLLSSSELAAQKRRTIDAARDEAFAAGLPYDIAGEPDVVQTRQQDQINLLGLSSKAQRLIAAGDTTTLMPFRGLSNETHMLTAEKMDTLALDALAHIEGIYQRSWDRKDAIDQALAAEDREGIEAVEW